VFSGSSDPSLLAVTKVTSCPFLAACIANAAVTLSVPPFDCIKEQNLFVYSSTNNREVEKVLWMG
jgi:hypothetical protein